MPKVSAQWSGSRSRFDVASGSGHSITLDEGGEHGDDAGMRPTELLLAALAGCTGINAVLLLAKFRQPLASLAVEVEGEQASEWPRAFTSIRVTFVTEWNAGPDDDLVAKALEMSVNRYCPVDATLTGGASITHSRRDMDRTENG